MAVVGVVHNSCMAQTFRLLWGHRTTKGTVFIGQTMDGRYHPVWRDESLGSYRDVAGAIGDVAGGHVFTPSDGTDMGALGISADPGDWLPARDLL